MSNQKHTIILRDRQGFFLPIKWDGENIPPIRAKHQRYQELFSALEAAGDTLLTIHPEAYSSPTMTTLRRSYFGENEHVRGCEPAHCICDALISEWNQDYTESAL